MRVSILHEKTDKIFVFDVRPIDTIEDIKALIEVEAQIPLVLQELFFQGKTLNPDNKTVQQYGINNDDMLTLKTKRKLAAPSQKQQPISATVPQSFLNSAPAPSPFFQNPFMPCFKTEQPRSLEYVFSFIDPEKITPEEFLKFYLETRKDLLEIIKNLNPDLYKNLIDSQNGKNLQFVKRALLPKLKKISQDKKRKMELEIRLSMNPYDVEAQKLIEELIKEDNIQENYMNAMEYMPEAFISVQMLFINCLVNGTNLKAFVDTGAQSTIMTLACAKKCNIFHLIDEDYKGIASGVGMAEIVGKVHLTQMKVGKTFFNLSITILNQKSSEETEFILGLDMLKRHNCTIDLKKGCLQIGDETVPFLDLDVEKSKLNAIQSSAASSSSNVTDLDNDNDVSSPSSEQNFEENLERLTKFLNIPKEQARTLLMQCGGNLGLAMNSFFDPNFKK